MFSVNSNEVCKGSFFNRLGRLSFFMNSFTFFFVLGEFYSFRYCMDYGALLTVLLDLYIVVV